MCRREQPGENRARTEGAYARPHENAVRLEAVVRGRVQGVMFRDFVRRSAKKLGLSGFVRNEQDGSVLIAAEGNRAAIQQLLERVRKGPLFARVDDVAVTYADARGTPHPFIIQYQ